MANLQTLQPGETSIFKIVAKVRELVAFFTGVQVGEWTPAIAAGTPGDINIVYSLQFGRYTKIGRTVIAHFNLTTSTFTHTTASGQATITGLPFVATEDFVGTMVFSGITKATFTQFAPVTASGFSVLAIECSGTGVGIASLQITNMPTAGTVILRGTVVYETDA